MQELFLLGLFVLALYYLYRRLVKKRNCNCASEGCAKQSSCPSIEQPPSGDEDPS